MKKILCAMLLLVFVSGCTGAQSKNDIGLLKSDVLKVAMEIGYPPFEYYDDSANPTGFDVALAAEIGKILGVKVEYEDTAWDGIFAGLDVDKYDVIMSAVTINAERKKSMDFSTPYIQNWQAIAVKKGSPAVASLAELNGLNVGFQDATTSNELLDELIDTGEVTCTKSAYDKVINAFEDLRLGRIDAVLCDSTVADGYIGREPDQFEISWHQSSVAGASAEEFGVVVKKDNAALLKAVNDALKQLEENGTLNALRSEWLS